MEAKTFSFNGFCVVKETKWRQVHGEWGIKWSREKRDKSGKVKDTALKSRPTQSRTPSSTGGPKVLHNTVWFSDAAAQQVESPGSTKAWFYQTPYSLLPFTAYTSRLHTPPQLTLPTTSLTSHPPSSSACPGRGQQGPTAQLHFHEFT